MEIVKFQQDQIIAKKNDKVNYWYLVQEGTVIQHFEFSDVVLEKNAIIGIFEKNVYMCDYVAGADTVLAAFFCENTTDLKNILTGQEKIRNIFLRAAVSQRHQLLSLYSELNTKARQFHMFVETLYVDYKNLCTKYRIEQEPFPSMEHFKPLEMLHKAEAWEVNNSVSIMKNYLQEYLQLMAKDDSLTIGIIMEVAAQMRRVSQGIGEMEAYLSYNKDLLLSESRNDLFALLFNLSIKTYVKKHDIEPIVKDVNSIVQVTSKLKVYNPRMVARRFNEFKNYDYAVALAGDTEVEGLEGIVRKEIDILSVDCLSHILEYAGFQDSEIDSYSELIEGFFDLPDRMSTDKEVYSMRRKVTAAFYEIYLKVFLRAVKDESSMTPIIDMFLNFGFMDVRFVGEEHAKALYELSAHLDICQSEHVYTMYKWLKAIYKGRKEPSKNELDSDYAEYLAELKKTGKITDAQVGMYLKNGEERVKYEIENMFTSVNKVTYGKITTFCPILSDYDLGNSIDKILVTADKLEEAMNEIRKIDYSIFYREIVFSDPDRGINNERIMKEVLPDILLMPNVGSRVIMWQEITGKKSDTPGRFMFSIFTMLDVKDLMLEVMGAFRWELCRRIQGIYWNDIREKSLTAEYCDYIQFYAKNRELSAEAKAKVKNALNRAKHNYREVFVRDYVSWINFESKGSFRLNKVAREILVKYCPFPKAVRNELKVNPVYQISITKFESELGQKLKKYRTIYDKYEKAGGKITEDLKENMLYYQM